MLGHRCKLKPPPGQHVRHGIARRLVARLIEDAIELRCRSITTDASITAKPFFLAMGFREIDEQTVECRGQILVNYKMERPVKLVTKLSNHHDPLLDVREETDPRTDA